MPRSRPVNPFSLPRPRRPVHVTEIESPHGTFRFALVKSDIADVARATDSAEKLIAQFVGPGKELPIANLDDSPIIVMPSVCRVAMLLSIVQRAKGDDGEECDTFTPEEYIAMSITLSDVYTRLQLFRQEIEEGEDEEEKKTSLTETSSIMGLSDLPSDD